MKNLIIYSSFIISILSCSFTKDKEVDSGTSLNVPLYILDSNFIRTIVVDTSLGVDPLTNPRYGRSESIYDLLKENAQYYEIGKYPINDKVSVRLLTALYPEISHDGEFSILFLATYDSEDKEITNIRVAKFEMISDSYALEVGTVYHDSISIRKSFETIGYSETVLETYTINDEGRISKSQANIPLELASKVALQFINGYVANSNKMGGAMEITEWVAMTKLTTTNFNSALTSMLSETDPELGLGFDPVFNAQDYPDKGFEVESINTQSGHIVLKGKDWEQFKVSMSIKYEAGDCLVDGCGVVNNPDIK